jgi:heme O synthase-like polyprenyltransferase
MGHRAVQAFGVLIVIIGVLNLLFRVRDGAGWFAILGAAGQLVLFSMVFASTIYARRQNRPDGRR